MEGEARAPTGEADLAGQTLVSKYRIHGMLGQGGMGLVWRATHVRTGRDVAIKMLDERFLSNEGVVQRFGREARAASAIQHPGIVEVLDLDQTSQGVPFLVMEMLKGETLAERIDTRGRLTQSEALEILEQLLEALDAAHAHGVVHRDLKPDNIFLVPRKRGGETVKILDFGISQKEDERVAQLTMVGSVLGTPHYMAPEQAMGEPNVDGRVDVYAASIVLYECLVGDVPFDAPNYNRLIHVILNDEPRPPTARGAVVVAEVEEVILAALSKDREQRPATAGKMLAMLQHAVGQGLPCGRAPAVKAVAVSPAVKAMALSPAGSAACAAPALPEVGDLVIGAPTRRSGRRAPVGRGAVPSSSPPPPGTPAPPPGGGERDPPAADPLSFEAAFADASSGSPALELDEAALSQPVRSSRVRSLRPRPPSSGAPRAPTPEAAGPRPSAATSGRRHGSGAPVLGSRPEGRIAAGASSSWFARVPKVVWYLALGLLVFASAVVGLRMIVRPGGAREAVPRPAAVAAGAPAQPRRRDAVRVDILGLPAGATVKIDGLPAGSLPLQVRRGSSHTLELSAPGYTSRRLRFTAHTDQRLPADLRPQVGVSAGGGPP